MALANIGKLINQLRGDALSQLRDSSLAERVADLGLKRKISPTQLRLINASDAALRQRLSPLGMTWLDRLGRISRSKTRTYTADYHCGPVSYRA